MSEKPDIPESWAEVTIDVLLERLSDGRVLHHGWSPQCEAEPSTSDNEWGVLKTTAVQDGLYLEEHNKRLPASLTPRQHLEVKTGDILITCAGPRNRCGVPCLVRHTRQKLILSGKMYRFRVHEAVMDAAFLEGYLRAKDTQAAIDKMKTGISDSGLNLTHGRFFRLKVPVAPLNEQRRIVAKIEELFSDLDAGVAALQRAKVNLKRYRAAVLKAAVEGKLTEAWRAEQAERAQRGEIEPLEPAPKLLERILKERREQWEADQLAKFAAAGKTPPKNWRDKYVEPTPPDTSGLPTLPAGWCWASVDQLLCESTCNGISVKGSDSPPGVPALRLNSMMPNGFNYNERRYIPISAELASDLAVQPRDLFVSRGNGSLHLVGRCVLAQEAHEIIVFPDTMIRVRVSNLGSLREFINLTWASRLMRKQIEKVARTTAGIYKISQRDVEEFVIPFPTLTEQREIVSEAAERLSQIDTAETAIEHGLKRAARLRQSILKQAFEGKLVPQDPNDEPASVLLERLRASRAAHEDNGQATTQARKRARRVKTNASGNGDK